MSERTLKEQALLERISEITLFYEDRDSDRRVEITTLVEKIKQLEEQNKTLVKATIGREPTIVRNDGPVEVVEGEVVEETTEEQG